ncbi:hypothetical protein [Pseudoxanthomonas sp. z9]|uniref:hypothetical protein n=1 Tax=Pseudoxanthomonas sp. z9 TaxID=2584942 RepID=UPI001141FE4A|nr:hypothetical protein [Pseudoxanthomonas sp. z9]
MNKRCAVALLLACIGTAQAQQRPVPPPPIAPSSVPAAPASANAPVPVPAQDSVEGTGDPLFDALTCRSGPDIGRLLPRLRRERPDDFVQAERQYSDPPMDLYRLETPVQAWGHESDAVVITANRVLMVVGGSADDVARVLEASLADSQAPLSGALDDLHALVLYTEDRPGLRQRVLIGCEYRFPDLALLDDPDDAWRKTPTP